MASQLLHTKCYLPPARVGGVTRPYLLAQLDAGLRAGHRLSLIAAPAGYGKTTLAASWVRQAGLPVIWLTLDARDNDLGHLLRYLRLAITQLGPERGRSLHAALDAPAMPPLEDLVAAVVHDLEDAGRHAAAEGEHLLLTLDDCHKLEAPAVHAWLALLVEHLPPACHLLLISREDPPLPLPRMRARGQLTELRAQELRFTTAEAAQFFAEAMQLPLPPAWVAALEARTEGWVASLQLAALSLQGRSPDQGEAFIRDFSGSHRFVFDYLAEEVLGLQAEDVRTFLRRTAVLERFHAPLCQALTGRADSQAMLRHLEHTNLFLVPLDDERMWYRYHHLFADYLRSTLPAEERAQLLGDAARWCADAGLLLEAVQYALESGDPERIAATVERALQQAAIWSGGELAMLVRWIDALPGQVLDAHPRLCLDASRALFLSGRLALASQLLDQAERTLRVAPPLPEAEGLLAIAEVYRAALAAFRGEVRYAVATVTRARPRLPASEPLANARAADALGLAYGLAGDLAECERWYAEASRLGQAAGVSYLAINARCEVATAQLGQGRLNQARETCREALALAGGAPIPPTGLALVLLGEIAYEQDDLAAAEEYLREGMARSEQGGLHDDLRVACLLLARLRRAQGDFDAAATAVERAAALIPIHEAPRLDRLAEAWRAWVQLARGNIEAAGQWARGYAARRRTEIVETSQDGELLVLARVSLAQGNPVQAIGVLQGLEGQALAAGRVRTAITVLVLLALAQQTAQDRAAVGTLARALQLAAPEGFVRCFLDEGAALAPLVTQVGAAAPRLVRRLRAALTPAASPATTPPPVPGALSEQELRVLQLMVAGHSNEEIAEALVIAVGTAKWHVHNILQKLEVSNRPKAIARARELGLA
jgi:LuxR family transcriptional regulator, maltose regulon positive regulatory protein